MNQIAYHYAQPEKILNLDEKTFELLMHSNIYRINQKFAQNKQCMERLVKFIKTMETSSKNLKIVKDLVRTFQSSILFFLKDFYTNSQIVFNDALEALASDSQKTGKKKAKFVSLLKEISLIYKKITEGVKIEEFEFFNKYGTSQKQMNFTRNNPELHSQYLWFLKRCFQEEFKMKDPNITPKSKLQSLDVLQREFRIVIKDYEFYYLEQLTFKTIHKNFSSIIESTKNGENSLQKNGFVSNGLKKDQKTKFLIDPDDLEAVRNVSPCCRTFFYQNEPIHHAESFTLEYKNYQSPYDKYCITNIKKAICGFLNRDGGVILVGILEREDKFKQVKGQYLSENEKEEVIKEYRAICAQIFPNIIGPTKYSIKFVPIKAGGNNYIPGKYIVRVEVAAGNQKSLYTYKEAKGEFVALRTANEVLQRNVNQQILLIFKQRLLNPKQVQLIHEKSYPEPQIGLPTWQDRSIYNKNRNYDKKRNKKLENNEDGSDEKSSDESKKRKKISWTEKLQRASFVKKDKKSSDYVYFSEKATQSKQQADEESEYRYKFICDDDEDEKDKNNRKKGSDSQLNQFVKQEDKNEQNNDNTLDFRPLNPVINRKKPELKSKKPIQYIRRQENLHIQEPNQINQVPYKLQGISNKKEVNQKSISETQCIDLLIAGFPFKMISELVQNYDLRLVEEPVQCNGYITWIKISNSDVDNQDKYQLFNKALLRKHEEIKIEKKLRLRKIYPNLIFQDQILLNKLIHKFRHNQEFTDRDGCIYYSFKDKIEAIQGYMVGWEMNIKMKFISESDLKKYKLEYLKFKAEGKF